MEVFMDDFSVYGKTFDGCLANHEKVLQRCQEVQLVLNQEKCHFMVNEGIILGHLVSKIGIEVVREKTEVIKKLPPPSNIKGIHGFLGHAAFYRRFIHSFSQIVRPLTKLLTKDVTLIFHEDCLVAFNTFIKALTPAPIIQTPD